MYCAYITELRGLRKHSNADRLQCCEVFGNNVIVDLSYYEGQKVIYFPTDGQLSKEFATENNLVRKKDENGNQVGGYLDPEKRNIKAIKLRGEQSDGLVLPIGVLSKYTDVDKLQPGDQISVIDEHEICTKYIPRGHNRRHHHNGNQNTKKKAGPKITYPFFEEHIDTAQLKYNMNAFKEGDTCYITRKMHGTSARSGNMLQIITKKRHFILKKVFKMKDKEIKTFKPISGSRRVVLNDYQGGCYGSNEFRYKYHQFFAEKLPKGMEIFYEIVGYVDEERTIMGSCDNKKVQDKEFTKKFGKQTVFSYGCEPGQNDIYVYRMTMTNPDGVVIEIPWEEVKMWCERLGVKYVPELEKFIYTTPEDLRERVDKYITGMPADEIGKTHVAEGVCVRIDNRSKFTAYKDKVFEFKVLEGIIKENADAPDMEEAQEIEA